MRASRSAGSVRFVAEGDSSSVHRSLFSVHFLASCRILSTILSVASGIDRADIALDML